MQVQFDKQYPVYAFDTACFYDDEETALDHELQSLRFELAEKMNVGITMEDKAALNKKIKETKNSLKTLIDKNVSKVRTVREESLKPTNVVQVFESTLIRKLHMDPNQVNEAMVIVKVYYFGIAEGIIKNGFDMNGRHYVFFSASAGQIRTKKFVAIQEDLLKACENALTCGLSIDAINKQGGVNINKYLAYLALSNSATEEWADFPIDKTIVIDDFETNVPGLVDFIDEKDYSIQRVQMDVPVTHTDGCGLILPQLSTKNFMVRAPWVKGLLSPFPFDLFIREMDRKHPEKRHAIITDIYGVEHNILSEHIQVILTKSQFKMNKYYKSFKEYQDKFKAYGCSAGKCNIEPTLISKATINYQMLQTLVGMTDDELRDLCSGTNRALSRISTDRTTMLRVLGAHRYNTNKGPFQQCLELYPELLQDEHCKNVLRDTKKKMETEARAGKLMIDGKYQFLIPDLYAACEHWFCGIETPEGLLHGKEVYSRQYPKAEKLDVLRSPHLYKEHAVRPNVSGERGKIKKWFNTNGIYTSSHDLISKILQFDNDGDKALVVADRNLVPVAERESSHVVPLYYPMAKAAAVEITPTALYDGMVAAWTGGNIGEISNSITKIWNSKNPDEDAVKVLCMENNFVIDYAKTLYKPTRPAEWDERLKGLINGKLPYFFQFAKKKTRSQVEARGAGVVDRLYNLIQIYQFDFNSAMLGKFDYRMLMYNEDIPYGEKEAELVKTFRKLSSCLGNVNGTGLYDEDSQYWLQIKNVRKEILKYGSVQYVTDVLVRGLFHEENTRRKAAFWACFGDTVYENLTNNVPAHTKICVTCGRRFRINGPGEHCPDCNPKEEIPEVKTATCICCGELFKTRNFRSGGICPACKMMQESDTIQAINKETVAKICVDCGRYFISSTRGRPSIRCPQCQKKRNGIKVREWKLKNRSEL